jgi:hypothetical protein
MIGVVAGRWEGLEGLGDDALMELKPDAEHRVVRAQIHMVNALKLTLTGQRSGRTYRVSKTGRLHTASAPGEPPAVLFGNLRNSVGAGPIRWDGFTVEGEIGIGLGTKPAGGGEDPESYGRRLEWGGIDSRGVRILPRPYMEPTVIREQDAVEQILGGP